MTPSEQRYPEGSGHPHPVRVAIAGGGIGGMALALSLHDAGFRDVDVYESASSVKELGVGSNVLPHATRELTELGLLDALDAVGIPTAELAYYSKHGHRSLRRAPLYGHGAPTLATGLSCPPGPQAAVDGLRLAYALHRS
jgi:2-polyprenyl-6-methoxyphenol hydroxylase-like FAD-dependent oxidoreductase